MQIKSFVAVAALALTVKAEQELTVGKGGALDFSKHGGVAVAARGVPEANQAAHGPVAFGGAMDFSKPSKSQNKRQNPYESRSTTCTEEDLPWIPEWTPGASVVGEVQETSEAVSAVPTSSVLQKGQVASTSSHPAAVTSLPSVAGVSTATPVFTTSGISTFPAIPMSSHASGDAGHFTSANGTGVSAHPTVRPSGVSSHASAPSSSSTLVVIPSRSSTPIAIPSSPITHATSATTPIPKVQGSSTPASAPVSTKTGAHPVTSTPGAAVTSAPVIVGSGTHGPLTFKIVNSMADSITISYQLGTYSPATGGATTVASSLIGPSATTGVFAKETTVVAPVGWAGRMTIGKAGALLDYRGTKIEGNNGFNGADPHADPDPDVDVSYVDGYSVPASCSCGDVVLTGCNKELFDLGSKCTNLAGDKDHPVCVNDPRPIHGPANAFFAPCKAAAYTYDYDGKSPPKSCISV